MEFPAPSRSEGISHFLALPLLISPTVYYVWSYVLSFGSELSLVLGLNDCLLTALPMPP